MIRGSHRPGVRGRVALLFVVGTVTSGCGRNIPWLLRDLRKGDALTRRRAALTLYCGVERRYAKRAAVALAEAISDDDSGVRSWSVRALGRLGGVTAITPLAVGPLTQALKDEHFLVRRRAAQALRSLGPRAQPAVGALSECLRDDDSTTALVAAVALAAIGPGARAAIPALNAALTDRKSDIRLVCASVVALHKLDAPAADQKRAVQVLITSLKDRERLAHYAAETLGEIGPKARAAVPALVETLRTGDKWLRRDAAEALGKIGPGAREAVPALLEALGSDDEYLRHRAARALVEIEEVDAGFVRALGKSPKRGHSEAIDALCGIPAGPKGAVPLLIEALSDKDGDVRHFAASALGRIGPTAKPAVRPLIRLLHDEGVLIRLAAAEALGRIHGDPRGTGEASPPLIRALVGALKDEESSVRWSAAQALGEIGPAAKEAVPALTDALNDNNRRVRNRAALAMEKIQAAPATAATQPTGSN